MEIQNFNNILNSFKIKASCVNYKKIDNYFFYDLVLTPKSKIKDIQKYSDEICLALKTSSKPQIKVLHEEGIVRLEFLQPRNKSLNLFDILSKPTNGELNCLLGAQADGSKVWMDLAQNPHLIVAGTTGSGKSVLLHNIVANLLKNHNIDLYLIDPKNIEFAAYDKFKNVRVYYNYRSTLELLNSAIELMERRYASIRSNASVVTYMKHQIFIIDEFADLIMQDNNSQLYNTLCRLAQKCRAAKMHIILATQRPSVNFINGSIKANFPARIACRVASAVDSKVILDSPGAENLLGKGDALIRDNFRTLDRFQVAYTSYQEVIQKIS